MANKRYGLKEVANVIFFDISTNKPAIFFDTLKVSTIENESESAEARGGQGNGRLMSWDFGRSASLTMQDALLSDKSLSLLAGTTVKTTGIKAVGREVLTVSGGSVTLAETPVDGTVTVYEMQNGIMLDEVTAITILDKEITVTGLDGKQVMAFYEYEVTNVDATQVTFSANQFPATYRVVGDTIVRGEDGIDRKMQFQIPKAKLQSTFSLTMDVENVSTFDFNLEVLVEAGTNKLYDIIRL
jgi:hypothetical protein